MRRNPTPAEVQILRSAPALGLWFQFPVKLVGPRGRVKFEIFDFYHPVKQVAVEVDGGYHKRTKGPDARRDRMCAFNDIRVVRVTNKEAMDGSALEKIRAAISLA